MRTTNIDKKCHHCGKENSPFSYKKGFWYCQSCYRGAKKGSRMIKGLLKTRAEMCRDKSRLNMKIAVVVCSIAVYTIIQIAKGMV